MKPEHPGHLIRDALAAGGVRLTEYFITEAIDFVRCNHQWPFFLCLPFTAPHLLVEAHPDRSRSWST